VLVESWGNLKGNPTDEEEPHDYRRYYPTHFLQR
jgi:hypothetical protein